MFNPNIILKNATQQMQLDAILSLIARILMSYLFIVSGVGKYTNYAEIVAYMEASGVSGSLLPLTILLEVTGGLALLLGFQTRLFAIVMAICSLVTAVIFHNSAADMNNFMKNMVMAGGFIFLLLHGAGKFSLDQWIEK